MRHASQMEGPVPNKDLCSHLEFFTEQTMNKILPKRW